MTKGKKYGSRLDSLKNLRIYLARKINEYDKGELEAEQLRVISYALQILKSILTEGEIEIRLKALEKVELERGSHGSRKH